jgi:hypothetical protein
MSNRNFDASFFTKRIRDINVAQNVQNAINSGTRVGNPVTALNEATIVNQFRPGVQTIFQRGNTSSEASVNIGGIANSDPITFIPRGPRITLPGRAFILGIDPDDRQLIIRFSPPNDNASSIINYKYSTDNGLTFRSLIPPQTTSPINIYGLINGSNYDVLLKPVSSDGDGESTTPIRATPFTFPSKPNSLVATHGNASASINFVAGNSNGSNITKYQYSLDNSNFTDIIPTGNNINISGLVNGNNTTIYLRAVNAKGPGPTESISITPSTIPDPPSFSTVTTGDQSISVSFIDNSNGGNSIFEYQYSTDGNNYTTITNRSFNLSGLTNGNPVPVYVRSRNANGYSTPVIASYTPATIPSAPSFGLVDTGDGSIIVNFTGSASNGGSAITSYQYSTDGTNYFPLPNTTDRSFTISGLTNGNAYNIRFKAVNDKGSSSVISTSATPATIPDPPSFSTISTSSGAVTVNFTDGFNGGSSILDYEYSTDGNTFTTIPSRSFSLSGLTNGSPVPIYVRARNAKGRSTVASTTATPSTIPNAPTSLLAGSSNTSLIINVTDGPTGGSPITSYKYRISPTYSTEYSASSNPFTISGLTNGTSYTIRVYAVNVNGTSSTYTTVSGTPSTIPNAPTSLATTVGNGTITVTVTNGSTGGSAITGYTYYLSSDSYVTSYVASSSPFTISSLTNNVAYTIRVYAMNANGNSSTYTATTATPAITVNPPTGLTATPDINKITISFTPGSNGSPVTNYQYSTNNGTTFKAFSPAQTGSSVDITTVSNSTSALSTGVNYTILLKTVTADGVSSASSSVIGRTLIFYTNQLSTQTWIAPAITKNVTYLIVGAGGGGGPGGGGAGGGGGGGMVKTGTINSITGGSAITVTVGTGGTGGYSSIGGIGGNSSFYGIIAYGGQGGKKGDSGTGAVGLMASGTSGGTGGQGNYRNGDWVSGGGGGGAGGNGGNATSTSIGGSGISVDGTIYGKGGNGGYSSQSNSGNMGSSYGNGGNGGSLSGTGGPGADGYVYITYYA